ncbi:hypothetical protein [Bacillus weihaiensis]|nr:hypothetical protein [Bacillus weihaiensis]
MNFDEPLTTKSFKNSSSGNGEKIQEDEVMKVRVKWLDQEETFDLTAK